MKTLVLDLGNSTLFGGVFQHDKLLRTARIEMGAKVDEKLRHLIRGEVGRVALCSVVPDRTARLVRQVRAATGLVPRVLDATADHGLGIAYRQPEKLGADRVAVMIGARKLYPKKNIIVVDCGTATTLTLLRRDGTLLGGSILPGLGLWSEMLAQRTARLPQVSLQTPGQVVARDTVGALRSGIVIGHAGAVRELVARSRAEAFGRGPVVVIGTGGMAAHLKGQRLFTVTEPALILHGLQSFLHR